MHRQSNDSCHKYCDVLVPVVRLEPATLALRAPCLILWAILQLPARPLLVPSSFSLLPVGLKSESLPDVRLEPATLWFRVALSFEPASCGLAAQLLTPEPSVLVWAVFSLHPKVSTSSYSCHFFSAFPQFCSSSARGRSPPSCHVSLLSH